MKRLSLVALKLTFSVALLLYLLYQADFSEILEIFQRADGSELLFVILLCFLSLEVSCYKWQRLLRHVPMFCSLGELTRVYLIGYYFNNFLPTSIGGDSARAYWLARDRGKPLEVATSIFVERLSGLGALVPIGLAGLILTPALSAGRQRIILGWGLVGMLLLSVAALTLLRSDWCRRLTVPERGPGLVGRIVGSLRRYLSDRGTVYNLVWTSVLFQLLVVLIYYQAGRALELDLSFVVLLAVVPLVTLVTLLPISFNGLGLREGGFVLFLAQVGVDQSAALSLSLLVYGVSLLFSLAGGIFFLRTKSRRQRTQDDVA